MIRYILLFLFLSQTFQKSDVFFTKTISSSNIVRIFKKLNIELKGKVGLKIHSGETGGKYFLRPDFLQEIYDYTEGTFIECNTAYRGARHSTDLHKQLLKDHGWLDNNRRTVIMDEDPSADFTLPIKNPLKISENIVGAHLKDYESCIVLSHLKGHPMGGFGGALKQLSIGFASQAGKAWIHTAGVSKNWNEAFGKGTSQMDFTTAMGDAASSIVEYFRGKGGIAFINVMANISKSCDCMGGSAPAPKIHDIGILASLDPVAVDRACLDLIVKNPDTGTNELLTQINNLEGENIIVAAEKHGIGTQEYNLIDIDEEGDEDDDAITIKSDSESELREAIDKINENGGKIYIDTPVINIGEKSSLEIKAEKEGSIIGKKQEDGGYPRLDFTNQREKDYEVDGIILSGSNQLIQNIILEKSNGNGIVITGEKNTLDHVITRYNLASGVYLKNTPTSTTVKNCYSYRNFGKKSYGKNGDGFSFDTGVDVQFDNCFSWDNSDNGFNSEVKKDSDSDKGNKVSYFNSACWNNGNIDVFTGKYDYDSGATLDKNLWTVQEMINSDENFESNYKNKKFSIDDAKISGEKAEEYLSKANGYMSGNGFQFGANGSTRPERVADLCVAFNHKSIGFDSDGSTQCKASVTNCVSFNNNINYQLPYNFDKWEKNWSWSATKSEQSQMEESLAKPGHVNTSQRRFNSVRDSIIKAVVANTFPDGISFEEAINNLRE